jgi:hypothetical protein
MNWALAAAENANRMLNAQAVQSIPRVVTGASSSEQPITYWQSEFRIGKSFYTRCGIQVS